MRPEMMLKWQDEENARPISREIAASIIKKNRNSDKGLRIKVKRKYREIYISSTVLNVACCIFRK